MPWIGFPAIGSGKLGGGSGAAQAQQSPSQQDSLLAQNIFNTNELSRYYQSQLDAIEKKAQQSKIECEKIDNELNKLEPVVKNILKDLDEYKNISYTHIFNTEPPETILQRKLDLGKKIQEHIQNHDFSKKLEGIINDPSNE